MTTTKTDPGCDAGVQEEACSLKKEPPQNKAPESSRQVVFDTLAILRARFPNCFARPDRPRRQPLKLKIHLDIAAALPELPTANIARALRFYTGNIRYRRDCTEGKLRFDLDGKPAGIVTADEATHCQKSVAGILAQRQKRQPRSAPDPAADPVPDPAPKRLTLSALREAGAKRRLETSGG
jgi:sRNA-binding protein